MDSLEIPNIFVAQSLYMRSFLVSYNGLTGKSLDSYLAKFTVLLGGSNTREASFLRKFRRLST